eukprot:TRINITY_DN35254_c0_g1_i1.p1 TRINITY_DN35254_c0_g1~~TRINITY_DN35254_c0_g1_i1.p1  ORF type:complete len:179 (-),score=21.91 TRINITY_DN35254_c0_g1_i1:253-789(-)
MGSAKPDGWFRRKVVDPLLVVVKRGAEPKQLALSAALGLTFGVFPICGVTVLLCGIAASFFGTAINTPTLMLANFVATPIELSLVLPFLRLGEFISGGDHFPLSTDALKKVITGHASHEVFLGIIHAIYGWLVASPFLLFTLYILFIPCFNFLVQKFKVPPSTPKASHLELKMKARNA